MKKIVLSLVGFCLFFTGCATMGTKVSEPVTYSEVVNVPGISKADLYVKANMWCVDAFKSAESVIQFSDKNSGVIKGKYIAGDVMAGIFICRISATITIEVKEGKYRISFTDPIYTYLGDVLNGRYPSPGNSGVVETEEMAKQIKPEWIKLAEDLKRAVFSKGSSW